MTIGRSRTGARRRAGGLESRRRDLGVAVLAFLVVGLAVAACAPAPAPTSGAAVVATPAGSAGAASVPVATPSAVPSDTRSSGAAVTLDESLLAILPAEIDGAPVSPETEAFNEALADPAFVDNVEAAAFATVVSGTDLASGVVARLRPDRFSEAFFRDWRDTYDQGACAQAGGIAGHAQAELGGRTVYIGTCAGGLRTYHAWVAERGVVVSLFSLGEARFGERLMSGLRP